MLDFAEVGRRIEQRNHQIECDACAEDGVLTHEQIVAPLIGQLLDPEYHGDNGTVLHTHVECTHLALTLQRQAQLLDAREAELDNMQDALDQQLGLVTAQSARVRRLAGSLVVAALWLAGVVAAVLIGKL
jgi:hypothetical protein